ncbi:hypothetical protein LOC67_27040 [Stieleria sp. JC731]|uniref:hypothetical protein n=1 Tax=Stieleria sp. JC731 TaxID=2894195 RepID=UPI001E3C14B7|nr:hypothetical protein [Stieleria sp. JC731]MCC9604226.1 hypothetical protein [Stieleria sp. JC731]
MNRSDGVGVFEVVSHPPSLGYVRRSPTESMNAYDRLRPTTDVESCDCDVVTELVLVDLLTSNPIHCAVCRREVDAERIGLTERETEAVAEWHGVASSLYRLWLDSGEYEDDAKRWLQDPQGQVNKRGREIAVFLSIHHPTRLWYFHDADDATPVNCPVCGGALETTVSWGVGICRPCHIHI